MGCLSTSKELVTRKLCSYSVNLEVERKSKVPAECMAYAQHMDISCSSSFYNMPKVTEKTKSRQRPAYRIQWDLVVCVIPADWGRLDNFLKLYME